MVTLILAAGYATRLYPLSLQTPKALFSVRNAPVIEHILRKTEALPDSSVYVITNNKFYSQFLAWSEVVGKGRVRIVNDGTNSESERLGAIGDIGFFLRTTRLDEDVLIIGGDNLFDWQLTDFVAYARQKNGVPVIGLFDVGDREHASSLGVVTIDRKGQVTAFIEKPKDPPSTLTSVCIYFFPRQTLKYVAEYIAENPAADTSGEFIRWLSARIPVYAHEFRGSWFDIGNKKTLEEAQTKFGR